ncbi:MAG: two-component system, cell cycle response regulator CtrA [Roseibaca calidilacus]|uniref:Two-component system, cell cycle response regulator CtrA n=1 Tax=Roseibaca calidilacus TaxID=1666912 RepID=A0A0N8K8U6_9RHOB|nr:response regulator transcription factor [Roseibaca calidilacus]KPP95521.1 MAG: two-component system, cell cycle response regulator CtrA [Roseibaca calidilacus]CUX82154.1 two-component system, cell cycle response regulator CtrA [Roseibaca calidilacus]
MKVLVVEDDGLMAQAIAAMLFKAHFNVTIVNDAPSALDMITEFSFDAVLLDLRLKRESGLDVLRKARERGVKFPMLVLSGDLEMDSKLAAFAAGADDYITKPFKIAELSARIQAVVRRTNGHVRNTIEVGPLVMDMDSRTVLANGKEVPLTFREYALLEALALRKGRTLEKETLLSLLYGGIDEPNVKIIDVFICKLRKKLSDALDGDCPIHTVWGHGYILRDQSGVDDMQLVG